MNFIKELTVLCAFILSSLCNGDSLYFPSFENVADVSNYTCDELTRWLGAEKHYSNDKRPILFSFLANRDCTFQKEPVVFLGNMSYGWSSSGVRTFISTNKVKSDKLQKCNVKDEYAVAYLSNFSINNNFSHFLHGLLRLFCALLDARWLVWDTRKNNFIPSVSYTIWLDEYFKIDDLKLIWIKSLGANIRMLNNVKKGQCYTAKKLLYGSGCVKMLPPEKWYGYPGCRAGEVLPAFGHFMRHQYGAVDADKMVIVDKKHEKSTKEVGLKIAFAVRDVGVVTGRRQISNLQEVQTLLRKSQHIHASTENVTFEHLDVPSMIRYMATVHIFVSVHGAGMTNMFFMNPGSAVVEIIPFPLCSCRSPDYFYGVGGYYYGSAAAQNIRHFHYCVPAEDVKWHKPPKELHAGVKCSWKYLHAVESVTIDPSKFASLMRNVERDLIAMGTIVLTRPIINMNPNASG